MVSGSWFGGRSTMKSSTTTPSPFSTISTALMSPPTPPMALATAPSEPGRSGRATRIRNTPPSFLIRVTSVFRPGVAGTRRHGTLVPVPALPALPCPPLRRSTTWPPLVAPPYDVLSDADVDALQARSTHNITHVDVPRGGDDRYEQAAELLRAWRGRRGAGGRRPAVSFTIYRLRFTDDTGTARDIAGVLGGLEVVDEGAGGVLPHERTTPKASTDRLDLTRATAGEPVPGLGPVPGLRAHRRCSPSRRAASAR